MHKFIRNFSNQITDFHVISDCKLLGIHQKIYLRSHTTKMHSTSFPRHQSNQNSLLTFSISCIVLNKSYDDSVKLKRTEMDPFRLG